MAPQRSPSPRAAQRATAPLSRVERGTLRAAGQDTAERDAQERGHPAAALSLPAILLGHGLTLGDVPLTLQVENPAFERVRPLFVGLIEQGTLPLLPRTRHDTPMTYLNRALQALGERHHAYLNAELTYGQTPGTLAFTAELPEAIAVDIEDFHLTLGDLHPRLSAGPSRTPRSRRR